MRASNNRCFLRLLLIGISLILVQGSTVFGQGGEPGPGQNADPAISKPHDEPIDVKSLQEVTGLLTSFGVTGTEPKRETELDLTLDNLKKANPQLKPKDEKTPVVVMSPDVPMEVQRSYHAYLNATYEHKIWALKQRAWIYEWQFWQGLVVFILAIGIVVLGLRMSWMQFYVFYQSSQAPVKSLGPDAPPLFEHEWKQLMNQIELSHTGVKISTPIVGIIILTLSLAFFYLYLTFVFQIT